MYRAHTAAAMQRDTTTYGDMTTYEWCVNLVVREATCCTLNMTLICQTSMCHASAVQRSRFQDLRIRDRYTNRDTKHRMWMDSAIGFWVHPPLTKHREHQTAAPVAPGAVAPSGNTHRQTALATTRQASYQGNTSPGKHAIVPQTAETVESRKLSRARQFRQGSREASALTSIT